MARPSQSDRPRSKREHRMIGSVLDPICPLGNGGHQHQTGRIGRWVQGWLQLRKMMRTGLLELTDKTGPRLAVDVISSIRALFPCTRPDCALS